MWIDIHTWHTCAGGNTAPAFWWIDAIMHATDARCC
jgi:hypothetical protein